MGNCINRTTTSSADTSSRPRPTQQDQPAQPEVGRRDSRMATQADRAPPELARRNPPTGPQAEAFVAPRLDRLPKVISRKIGEHLPNRDLGNLSETNRALREDTRRPLHLREIQTEGAASTNREVRDFPFELRGPVFAARMNEVAALPDRERLPVLHGLMQQLIGPLEPWHAGAVRSLMQAAQQLNDEEQMDFTQALLGQYQQLHQHRLEMLAPSRLLVSAALELNGEQRLAMVGRVLDGAQRMMAQLSQHMEPILEEIFPALGLQIEAAQQLNDEERVGLLQASLRQYQQMTPQMVLQMEQLLLPFVREVFQHPGRMGVPD